MQELLPDRAPAAYDLPDRVVLHALQQSGVQVLARPSRPLVVLVSDLLRPRAEEPAARREEVLARLAGLLRLLLSAGRVMLLRWDEARDRYTVWTAESADILRETGAVLDRATAPLPALLQLQRGCLVDRPSKNPAVDRQLGHLLGHGSAMLLPLSTRSAAVGVLALRLAAPPRPGEAQLALALAHQAATIIAGEVATTPAQGVTAPSTEPLPVPNFPPRQRAPLSTREQEVVQLVVAGLRNKEIAARLGISEKTVKYHLTHVFEKLGVESRIEVVLQLVEPAFALSQREHRQRTTL
ncbi:MAG TPA: helix-turn-helix transcriptional regulator [Chloroflexota bacterium]|jgi:DNA-binding CsgD family transcriptional regulator|nr:helix-turn-helix transcriptional regulator [Chloroflexota bacterium]